MKKKWFKKGSAVLLAAAMVLSSFPGMEKTIRTVQAAENVAPDNAYWTDAAGLKSFNLSDSDTIGKINFGLDGSNSRLWAICGADGANQLALLSTSEFAQAAYGDTSEYSKSNFVTGMDTYLSDTYFSAGEKDKMAAVTVTTNEPDGSGGNQSVSVADKKLYLPNSANQNSSDQATIYVGKDNTIAIDVTKLTNENGFQTNKFWLRSPYFSNSIIARVASPGSNVRSDYVYGDSVSVVPAFNLDLSSVIFASAAGAASSSYSGYQANGTMAANTYTLRYESDGDESAVISADNPRVTVTNAAGKYLMVQNSAGVYALKINSASETVNAGDIQMGNEELDKLADFTNCRVWLESTDEDRITTAKLATEATVTTYGAFTVTDNGSGTASYADGLLTLDGGNFVVSNTDSGTAATDRILIKGQSNITLKNVNINTGNGAPIAIYDYNDTNVTLTLEGDNYLTSTAENCAGLHKSRGQQADSADASKLTINGSGSLTAVGGLGAAGIGGGGYRGDTHNITIESGTIIATGSSDSAGIGSSQDGSSWNIAIEGGKVQATGRVGIGSCSTSWGSVKNADISGGYVVASGYSGNPPTGGLVSADSGSSYTVYSDYTLTEDLMLGENSTITVNEDATLTVADGYELINNGTIVASGAIEGAVTNNGDVYNMGNASLPSNIGGNVYNQCAFVTGGSGSGEYSSGTTVTITANTPEDGYVFKNWKVTLGEVTLASDTQTTTTFTMPSGCVKVEAVFAKILATFTDAEENVVNLTEYHEIEERIMSGGGTLTLKDDVHVGEIMSSSPIVIDLNGHILNVGMHIYASSDITIKNGTLSFFDTHIGSSPEGSLTFDNVTIETYSVSATELSTLLEYVDTVKVTGSASISNDFEIPEGKTLAIAEGATLTISNAAQLTNNGTLENDGTLTNNGTLANNGTIDNHDTGNINNSGTIDNRATGNINNSGTVSGIVIPALVDGVYQISTAAELKWFSGQVNDGQTAINGRLMKDIDMSVIGNWTPIGNATHSYKGTFDGNNKQISNLAVSTATDYTGFFGYLDGATVKDFMINSGTVTSTGSYVGGVFGYAKDSAVEGCVNGATISGGGNFNGGIGGGASGTSEITNCTNKGSIAAGQFQNGGILGTMNGGTIKNCINDGAINVADHAGGIVGWINDGTVKNCANRADVKNTNAMYTYVGGIVGAFNSGTVEQCYNTGMITGSSGLGCRQGAVIAHVADTDVCTVNNIYSNQSQGNGESGTIKADSAFASGEIAWLLNGESADGVWRQTLTPDSLPSFNGKKVYKLSSGYANVCDHSANADHEGVLTTAPTCTANGVKTYTCTVCGEEVTEDIEALGHDLIHHEAKTPTCTEKGWAAYDTCSQCDYSTYAEISATGHNPSDWITTLEPTTVLVKLFCNTLFGKYLCKSSFHWC